jgi:hypothetical protein
MFFENNILLANWTFEDAVQYKLLVQNIEEIR